MRKVATKHILVQSICKLAIQIAIILMQFHDFTFFFGIKMYGLSKNKIYCIFKVGGQLF